MTPVSGCLGREGRLSVSCEHSRADHVRLRLPIVRAGRRTGQSSPLRSGRDARRRRKVARSGTPRVRPRTLWRDETRTQDARVGPRSVDRVAGITVASMIDQRRTA